MQISDTDLAKIRLKCLELGLSHDAETTLQKAGTYTDWVMRDRLPGEGTAPAAPPPSAPTPPAPPQAAAAEPGVIDRAKSTLGLGPKNK